jgi:hypothetical protein
LATLLFLGGCGGGSDGGGGTVMLEGSEAVEGSVGVGLSTGVSLSALFLEVELSIDEAMTGSAGNLARADSGGGAGVQEVPCELGGSRSTACEVDARNGKSTIDLEFSDCRSAVDSTRRRNRDGHVRLVVLDPIVCIRGSLLEDIPFSLEFDGFRSRITDESGGQLAAFTANLTEHVTLASGGCLTSNGNRSANGSLDVEIADLGIDLSLEVTDLRFDVGSAGSPCEQTIVASGSMKVDDRANRLRFSQLLDETEITVAVDGTDTLVRIDGEIDNDCLGSVDLSTIAPVRLTAANGCPVAGSFLVALSGGAASGVDFRSGGVDLDFGDDGSTDKSVASCRDASLAQCVAR